MLPPASPSGLPKRLLAPGISSRASKCSNTWHRPTPNGRSTRCARASDRILLSSTPSDFSEPTHVNVREPAAWAASFAERGFFRRTDVDLSFVAPWTVLFERADLTRRDLVYRYERYAYPMRVEVLEKRVALRDAQRELQEPASSEAARRSPKPTGRGYHSQPDLRHKLLTSRDHAIGAEAEAAQWRLRYEQTAA